MKGKELIVVDLNGDEIEIEDLAGAIEQADFCRAVAQEGPQNFGAVRLKYWEDLHGKLQKLKSVEDGKY
ncbi:3-isopropylmalate dehydratase [Pedobacter xixiisoli]|uniref:Uncharacterized protein n=1 Tax=Pedobacter xixiisoli TaxID=1476464 RepID=A0A286A7A6_9SPHI|nr:3-isopropylmalate dehydratase [Pedobacter xixiisoli]SOD17767.1 hypothetical protein SAMN06297358_2677 [Pedobacter xixiisoli]